MEEEISVTVGKTVQEEPYEPVRIEITLKKKFNIKSDEDREKKIRTMARDLQYSIEDILQERNKAKR